MFGAIITHVRPLNKWILLCLVVLTDFTKSKASHFGYYGCKLFTQGAIGSIRTGVTIALDVGKLQP
jgi:hypothetical protein